ncbi:hypothetical protein CMI47_02450 [Candidatus Pacearchaeota archaeon]|nr:hypothetical protein [Candidatus Pacearchaeota archaeon]
MSLRRIMKNSHIDKKKMNYDYDYYERGEEAGVSCYTNYRWLPEQTIAMCRAIANFVGINKNDKILDFGCAKGFIVKALGILGYDCYGCDISEYAIQNADSQIKHKVFLCTSVNDIATYDIILAKDVLEHIDYAALPELLQGLAQKCKTLFVIVPLGKDGLYCAPEYDADITHVIRENKQWWEESFKNAGFKVMKSKYLVDGIKDQWAHYPEANGFFLLFAE